MFDPDTEETYRVEVTWTGDRLAVRAFAGVFGLSETVTWTRVTDTPTLCTPDPEAS